MERTNRHPFGSKKSPENFQCETDVLEKGTAPEESQETIALNHDLIQNYFRFIQGTLRQGKQGDINYAILGIVGELAELMKEMVYKQLGENNQDRIISEAGDVLWYTMLLVSTQPSVFQDIQIPVQGFKLENTLIQQILHWIDKTCKYGTQHDFDQTIKEWKPRENCISIKIYIEEILEFLLRYSDLTISQLITENMKKLDSQI